MRPFEMHGVDRVLLALEPVARDLSQHDLAKAVFPGEEFPIRHQGPRLGAEISPEEAAALLDRMGLDADLVFEPRLGMRDVLVRLRQAASVGAVQPTVIVAAQPAGLDIAVAKIGAAMPTMAVEEAVCAAEILVENKILAHQPHRLCTGFGQFAGARDRPPISAAKLAHRSPGAGLGQETPAAARLTS